LIVAKGTPRSEQFNWEIEDRQSVLAALWAEGWSAKEIGRRMGCSKNAVVGRAARTGLPKRPSPIRTVSDADASERTLQRRGLSVANARRVTRADEFVAPAMQPEKPLRAVFRGKSCQFIINDTKPFQFCGKDALSCGPYCGQHHEVAYLRVRDRREDAA
jgi:GcrA cell cycle regulator